MNAIFACKKKKKKINIWKKIMSTIFSFFFFRHFLSLKCYQIYLQKFLDENFDIRKL